jgi:3-oxoacyl-[acyl-carrier protein] reductase
MSDPFRLDGKIALVTGGSRGIGRAIALALSDAGADVALTCRERLAAAEEVAAEVRARGRRALALVADVRDRDAVRAALTRIDAEWGGLDVVVNNAGVNQPTDFDQVSDADWDEILGVNLKGPFVVSQEALPLLARRGGGAIVMIGSVSGQYGGPRTAHYAASKAGLISLAQVIARFGAARGVRCNTVAAGLIASEMAAAGLAAAAVQQAAQGIVLKRLGAAAEVARAVVFLASDAASYVTAQTLNVNGGLYF